MGEHKLVCPVCDKRMTPTFKYKCAGHEGLIYTEYEKKVLEKSKDHRGIWRYRDWMPVNETGDTTSGPKAYRSEALATELGLKNLWISFNGYWPLRKCWTLSGTFKEYEAVITMQRMKEFGVDKIVVASAGNTARAFAKISRYYDIEVIAVVPSGNLDNIWLPSGKSPKLTLVSVHGDYYDAIKIGEKICKLMKYPSEGGARNVARRDGMSAVVLDAVSRMKDIPKHYFQGIGSGTGGIAAHEAAKRLTASGVYENKNMKLHLAQNLPFTPIHNAYTRGGKTISRRLDMPDAEETVKQVYAHMLTNRNPPYSIPGGVYDVLEESRGVTYAVENKLVTEAQELFKRLEGRSIVAEAGVALGALMMASKTTILKKDDPILLNISGGGVKGVFRDIGVFYPRPRWVVDPDIPNKELRGLFE